MTDHEPFKGVLNFQLNRKAVSWARPTGKQVRYDSQTGEKSAVCLELYRQLCDQNVLLTPDHAMFPESSPISVYIAIYFKGSPRQDVDNIAKFYLDALMHPPLTGLILNDDSQIVDLRVIKRNKQPQNKVVISIRGIF